jgi:hypothetical protein
MKKLTKQELAGRAQLVDDLGKLDAEIAVMAPKVAAAKLARELIAGWTEGTPAGKPVAFHGLKFSAFCSEQKNERTIDIAAFRQMTGEKFFAVATVKLGDADELAKTIPGIAACVTTDRTGKRAITTYAKAA